MTTEQTRARWLARRATAITKLIKAAQSAGVRLQSLDDKGLFLSVHRALELGPSYLARIAFLNGWRLERK